MVTLPRSAPAIIKAQEGALVMLVAGDCFELPRHKNWNFVSSRPERIAQAMRDWANGAFSLVPGDSRERIPHPGEGQANG